MAFKFSHHAVHWLEKHKFRKKEVEVLAHLANKLWQEKEERLVIIPRGTPEKVGVLLHALASVTDADGVPACFKEGSIMNIPLEVKKRYTEGLELAELEEKVSGVGRKVRGLGRPKQRDLHRKGK